MQNGKLEQLTSLLDELWQEEMEEYRKTLDEFGKDSIETKILELRTNVIGQVLDYVSELWCYID